MVKSCFTELLVLLVLVTAKREAHLSRSLIEALTHSLIHLGLLWKLGGCLHTSGKTLHKVTSFCVNYLGLH